MDDGLYPNDGELFNAFQEPEELTTERKREQSKAQAGKALLIDLIALFEADITQLKSIDSIPETVQLDKEEFQQAWAMNQQLLSYARDKKAYLESLIPPER